MSEQAAGSRRLVGRVVGWLGRVLWRSRVVHAVVIVGLLVLVIRAEVSRRSAETAIVTQRAQLIASERENLTAHTIELLRVTAPPLGWAMRSALMDRAVSDIDAYLASLAKAPNVTRVALINPAGIVIAATDPALKGQLATIVFPATTLATTSVTVTPTNGMFRVVVPVMDFTNQIGTVVYDYAMEAITRRLPAT